MSVTTVNNSFTYPDFVSHPSQNTTVTTITVTNVNTHTFYTNNTDKICYCYVNITVVYDIIQINTFTALGVNNYYVPCSPFDNAVRFTGMIKLEPNKSIT